MQHNFALLFSILLASNATAANVTELADEYVAAVKESFPESATFSGLTLERHDGLSDNSQAAREKWEAFEDRIAREVAAIDSSKLSQADWVIHGFLREAVEASRATRVCRNDLWPVNQMSGWQGWMTQLAAIQPVGAEKVRSEALAAGQNRDVMRTSNLRKVSLTRLEREVQLRYARGLSPDEAMQNC